MLAAGVSSASRDPGETLKCCTLVGAKRVADAERQPAAAATTAGAAKRQRTQLLPPAAVAVLGESGTAYHKLVEFGRRVDVTLKHHRQALEARLRTAGVGPNGEIVSAYPVAPFHPVTRILRLHVDFQHESAHDPQLPASTRWMLRLWGVYADRPDVEVDLARHLVSASIQLPGSNPPVAVEWAPRPGAPNTVLVVSRISQLPPDRTAHVTVKVRQLTGPTQGVTLLPPLAEALGHPKESMMPFRQVRGKGVGAGGVRSVWG